MFWTSIVFIPDSAARQPQKCVKIARIVSRPLARAICSEILLLMVLLIMLILTVSRGGIIAFVITLLFVFRKKIKMILLGLFIIAVLFVVVPKPQSEGLNILRTASIQTRLIDYQKALKIWQKWIK